MKVLFLTNEYPPNIYGGAGIHVDYLSRELAKLCEVEVRCFGNQKKKEGPLCVSGYGLKEQADTTPKPLRTVLGAVQRCLDFNAGGIDADIVHVHTWYTHLGGILAKLNYSIPLVLTTHSLEPFRPWKREQLAGGYDFSCWVEKAAIEMADAVVAVSRETKKDILKLFRIPSRKVHVIYNGIDHEEFHPVQAPQRLFAAGVDASKPYVLFLGRITRQKGIIHLLNAIHYMDRDFQIVLCAGSPDTPEIAEEMKSHVARLQSVRPGVIWIRETLDTPTKIALFSHAAVFCCPSIYEPFGIINLEAMACETPVVASAVGGIKEVVINNKTGCLVEFKQRGQGSFEPVEPKKFEQALSHKINRLMKNQGLRLKMGRAGRQRVIDLFSWSAIAKQTRDLYQTLIR